MAKPFAEVFPQVKLNSELAGLLSEAEVERVSATRRRDFIRVYLKSPRLLPKRYVFALEKELKKQLFGKAPITIRIYERFALSSQYTLPNLLEAYWDSVLEEFHVNNPLQYSILSRAKLDCPEEKTLRLTLEDSILSRELEEEIYRVLEKIFNERCAMGIALKIDFGKKETSRHTKNAQLKMENVILIILQMSAVAEKE